MGSTAMIGRWRCADKNMGTPQRVAAASGQFARQYDDAFKESGYSPDRVLGYGSIRDQCKPPQTRVSSFRSANSTRSRELWRTLGTPIMQNRPPVALPKARCTALHRIPRFEEDVKRYSSFFGGPKGRPRPMRMEWHHPAVRRRAPNWDRRIHLLVRRPHSRHGDCQGLKL